MAKPEPCLTELLPQEAIASIDHWISKYPPGRQQSAVMAALTIAQDHHGWLTEKLMNGIADYLKMPRIAVYEVASFYSMYHLEPVGKHVISVCTNVSCMLCGSDSVVEHLSKRLGVKLGQTTSDSLITLKEVECLGACGGAPMLEVDKQYHENLTEQKIDEILAGLEK
ncbi:MAG: NADH-quinone oxidoreductase subunit NuoE [Kangiellaceae bacterium]|jgi:NADH-quinone oxidoreductase subunit E|nr:NADH-quinone oxidoreductase subunit NuoE [Kangiellaceae bacterium]|tara:strand:+ start:3274 stop:3777 length:504 start_codon:yes stop_codon:yes gene_type:complete